MRQSSGSSFHDFKICRDSLTLRKMGRFSMAVEGLKEWLNSREVGFFWIVLGPIINLFVVAGFKGYGGLTRAIRSAVAR